MNNLVELLRPVEASRRTIGTIMVPRPGFVTGTIYDCPLSRRARGGMSRLGVVEDVATELELSACEVREHRMRAQFRLDALAACRYEYPPLVLDLLEAVQGEPNPVGWCELIWPPAGILLGWSGDYLVAAVAAFCDGTVRRFSPNRRAAQAPSRK